MNPSDPDNGLASATLAQLYLEQGHHERAQAVCREVLEREPRNGHALILAERLRHAKAKPAQLEAKFVAKAEGGAASDVLGLALGLGELELRWSIPRELLDDLDDFDAARLDIVVAISNPSEVSGALRYTSVRCRELEADARLELPPGPASAAATLVLSAGPRRHSLASLARQRPEIRVLAVADALSW